MDMAFYLLLCAVTAFIAGAIVGAGLYKNALQVALNLAIMAHQAEAGGQTVLVNPPAPRAQVDNIPIQG